MNSIKERFELWHKDKDNGYDYSKDANNSYIDYETNTQYNIYLAGYRDGLKVAYDIFNN